MKEILKWINKLNRTLVVNINKKKLEDSDFWFYDEEKGIITNGYVTTNS